MRPRFTYRSPVAYRAPQLYRARPYEGYRLAWLYDRATQSVQELTEPGGGWDSNSVPYGQTPAVVTGDIMVLPLLTDPGLYAVTPQADGGFEVDLQGDGSRQILRNVNLYDRSLATFYGAADQAINDQAPIAFPETGFDRIYQTGANPDDEDMTQWFSDPEGDVLTFSLSPNSPNSFPAWISIAGNTLVINDPLLAGTWAFLIRATDIYGAYAEIEFRVTASSQVVVPSVQLLTSEAAEALISSLLLVVNYIEGQYSETYASGIILSQDPPAGQVVSAGTVITLIQSLGPMPEVAQAEVTVSAYKAGFFGEPRSIGEHFVITDPLQYSPYWMTLVSAVPDTWLPFLRTYDRLIDFDILEEVPPKAKVIPDFRPYYS